MPKVREHYIMKTMIATFACVVHNDAQAILNSSNYNGTNNHAELGKRARPTNALSTQAT